MSVDINDKKMESDICEKRRGQRQVYECLERMGIPYEYYEHEAAPTIEIASKQYRGENTVLCKNLFFRNHKGNKHYLVIMDSRHDMDIHAIEKQVREGKLSFASEERMQKYLGLKPGSVSLFGLVNDIHHEVILFVDELLLKCERVSFHPNDCTASLVISRDGMVKFIESIGNKYEFRKIYEDQPC